MGLRSWIYEKTGFNLKNLQYTPQKFMNFESLGDNCEFGFVLRAARNHESSFFRWVRIIDYSLIPDLIKNDFKGVFDINNIEPLNDEMVFDTKYKLSFHTKIYSEIINGKRVFINKNNSFINSYNNELLKIKYMASKFKHNLINKEMIYVLKQNNNNGSCIKELADVIKFYGNGKILNVKSSDDDYKLNNIQKIYDNAYLGHIPFFSDYLKAYDINYENWRKVLIAASHKII